LKKFTNRRSSNAEKQAQKLQYINKYTYYEVNLLKYYNTHQNSDHLGNKHVTFANDIILQRNDYYPFGMSIAENSYQKLAGSF